VRANYRAGVLAALLYNPNRRKGAPAKSAEDFFPELADYMVDEEGDVDDLIGHVRTMHAAFGGK
jgi:hypothetical protein